MAFDSEFLPAVNLIYQSVLEPDNWPAILAAITTSLQSEHSILVTDKTPGSRFALGVTAGLSDEDAARFLSPETAALWKPWQQSMPKARFVPTWKYVSDQEMEQSDMFQMVVRPANGYHGLCLQQETPDLSFHMAICRPRRLGRYNLEEAACAQALVPHLTTALQLQQRLGQSEARSLGLGALLDRLNDGAIVIDEAGRPLFLNATALAMVDAGDALRLGPGGTLRAASAQDSERLSAAINAVLRSQSTPIMVCVERGGGQSRLLLSLFPVERLDMQMPGSHTPRAAIFVREATQPPRVNQAILREVFNLTSRESETAALLASGLAPKDIAAALGQRIGTVRFNMKRIFEKTGAHSQASLVALVLGAAG
ncbi:DNA-binding transcriptional regulator, CsgD family [Rhizobiales bacterium GAS191]|nr:DNA-binding transcriptional regulator, CsgD family [Rhizobiales bacterium GAS188]SEE36712.1 DNA-binding transcriptional regulator, CsgD family [Rhizobiales bacterium GAS191]